jgi:predicted nucleic acid-binding protein
MHVTTALIDTNVLGYLFDADAPEKRRIARSILERCWRSECSYAVSVQNLAEFAVLVTEMVEHPMPVEDVTRFIRDITAFEGWIVVQYDGSTILAALTVAQEHRLHFWDALIVATMRQHGISAIVTEDRHFSTIPGITAIDPFHG